MTYFHVSPCSNIIFSILTKEGKGTVLHFVGTTKRFLLICTVLHFAGIQNWLRITFASDPAKLKQGKVEMLDRTLMHRSRRA